MWTSTNRQREATPGDEANPRFSKERRRVCGVSVEHTPLPAVTLILSEHLPVHLHFRDEEHMLAR
jgi:hypothetical protein